MAKNSSGWGESQWVKREERTGSKGDGMTKGGKKGQKGQKGKGKGDGKKGWRREEWRSEEFEESRSQLSSHAQDFIPSGLYDYDFLSLQYWEMQSDTHGWREFADHEGTKYYHNSKTGVTQWERPPELDLPPETKVKPAEDGQMKGFSRKKDPRKEGKGHFGKGGLKDSNGRKERSKVSKEKEDGVFGPPGCNLFVFHLPDEWGDEDLMEYFGPYGNIVSAKVMKELGTGRSRGFGFVSYELQSDAAAAIKKMQGYKILGKRLKVEFKKGEEPEGEEKSEKQPAKTSCDDERLIGYLRAISAQSVVQSLQESAEKEISLDSEPSPNPE